MGKAKPKFVKGDRVRIRDVDPDEGIHLINANGLKNGFLGTVVNMRRSIVYVRFRRLEGIIPIHVDFLRKVKE